LLALTGSSGRAMARPPAPSWSRTSAPNINPGIYPLQNVNGTLFFQADDGVHGGELWQSNGTGSGTKMVKDIKPGSKGSYPYNLANINGTLFFSANDGVHGVEPWVLGPVPASASVAPATSGIQTPESALGGAFATSLVARGSQGAVALLAVPNVRSEAGAVRVAAALLDGGSRKPADTVAAAAHQRRHNNAAVDELLTLSGWEDDRRGQGQPFVY
jgi:ELWxxDGT repeat protein